MTSSKDCRTKISNPKPGLSSVESPTVVSSRQMRECAGGVEKKTMPTMPPCSCSQKSISLANRVQNLKSQSESPRTWKDENQPSFNLRSNSRCDEETCAVDWDLPSPQLEIMIQQLSVPHYREVTADLIVKIRGQSFRTHRFLLAHFSKYFYTAVKQRQGKLFM